MDPLLAFDKAVGNAVERVVRGHHYRRLRKLGWKHALVPPADGLWAEGDPPPRGGNAVDVLIDGEEALPRIVAELRKARSHVHIAGWHLSPYFALTRDGRHTVLRSLLAELAERVDVRLLVWAGSPLPLFHPDRKDVDGVRHALAFGTSIHFAVDPKERPMHCHHEKLVVVDDRVAFVGGIDLTVLGGDRFDSSAHVARGELGWHDATALLRGPIVADVAEHFRLRWREIAEILQDKLAHPPSDDFRLVLVLPIDPNNGGDNTRGQLADLLDCDGRAGRVLACTITALGERGPSPVYVHAKIGIVDDRWFTIGSANVNEHSLFNDTEVNVIACEHELARRTRLRLWAEHLQTTERAVSGDPTKVVDELWRPLAEEQRRRRERGEQQTHRLSELPHLSRRTRRLLGPVQGLLVDG